MAAKSKKARVSTGTQPAGQTTGSAYRGPLVIALLALVTAAVFLPAIGNGFVNYDDPDYVTKNPQIQKGVSVKSLAWAFQSGHASNWHPLTWVSHMLDWDLYGSNPKGHHLMSVLLHAINAMLCFLALRAMTGTFWRSACVAAIFALHPLRVESVAWVSERKDVLSGLFFFVTLWAYGKYANKGRRDSPTVREGKGQGAVTQRDAASKGPGTRRWYVVALVAFALGLMSKPMLVTVPFLLLLLDWWPLRRGQPGGLKPVLLEKVPFLALAIVSSIVTFLVQREGGAVSSAVSLSGRLANAAVAYVRYVIKAVWPSDLAVLYPHPAPGHWPVWAVAICTLVLAAWTALAVAYGRKHRYAFVGWFWFVGMMVPVIGLVQVGVQSMADRYTYLPMIGLSIIAVWVLHHLLGRMPGSKPALAFGTGACLLVWSVLTIRQIGYWENSKKLFRRTVAVTTGNFLAYNNLGYSLSEEGNLEEAIECYQASLKINPNYEDALNNMGHALATQRKHLEAIPYYEAALRVRPKHVEVHNNLGNALSEVGQAEKAIQHYRFVLEQKPEHADAHNNLGIALAMRGQLPEAMDHFREAIRIRPSYASARSNLGNAYAVQNQFEKALEQYRECLRLDPNDAQAHNNMANVLVQLGQLDDAVGSYRKALALKEYNPEAHYNLGLVLMRQTNRTEALKHFQEALRQKPNYPEPRKQLEALSSQAK